MPAAARPILKGRSTSTSSCGTHASTGSCCSGAAPAALAFDLPPSMAASADAKKYMRMLVGKAQASKDGKDVHMAATLHLLKGPRCHLSDVLAASSRPMSEHAVTFSRRGLGPPSRANTGSLASAPLEQSMSAPLLRRVRTSPAAAPPLQPPAAPPLQRAPKSSPAAAPPSAGLPPAAPGAAAATAPPHSAPRARSSGFACAQRRPASAAPAVGAAPAPSAPARVVGRARTSASSSSSRARRATVAGAAPAALACTGAACAPVSSAAASPSADERPAQLQNTTLTALRRARTVIDALRAFDAFDVHLVTELPHSASSAVPDRAKLVKREYHSLSQVVPPPPETSAADDFDADRPGDGGGRGVRRRPLRRRPLSALARIPSSAAAEERTASEDLHFEACSLGFDEPRRAAAREFDHRHTARGDVSRHCLALLRACPHSWPTARGFYANTTEVARNRYVEKGAPLDDVPVPELRPPRQRPRRPPPPPWTLERSVWGPRHAYSNSHAFFETHDGLCGVLSDDWEVAISHHHLAKFIMQVSVPPPEWKQLMAGREHMDAFEEVSAWGQAAQVVAVHRALQVSTCRMLRPRTLCAMSHARVACACRALHPRTPCPMRMLHAWVDACACRTAGAHAHAHHRPCHMSMHGCACRTAGAHAHALRSLRALLHPRQRLDVYQGPCRHRAVRNQLLGLPDLRGDRLCAARSDNGPRGRLHRRRLGDNLPAGRRRGR